MPHTLTRTHLIAPRELIEEVDRLVGPRKRSEFFTEALNEKLTREKLLRATRHAMNGHNLPASFRNLWMRLVVLRNKQTYQAKYLQADEENLLRYRLVCHQYT